MFLASPVTVGFELTTVYFAQRGIDLLGRRLDRDGFGNREATGAETPTSACAELARTIRDRIAPVLFVDFIPCASSI